jgi:hypothetical protein
VHRVNFIFLGLQLKSTKEEDEQQDKWIVFHDQSALVSKVNNSVQLLTIITILNCF